jgi:hypothetical protein
MYDNKTSVELIESRFPCLSDDLHHSTVEGLLHVQIGYFASYAQDAIDGGDEESWSLITQVFIELWNDCHPDVVNALNVSFLEYLSFLDGKYKRSWAYQSMPQQMRTAWDEMDSYNRKLAISYHFHREYRPTRAGHDLGPFEPVDPEIGVYQAACRRCAKTVWVGDQGLIYSLLGESCAGQETGGGPEDCACLIGNWLGGASPN